MLGPIGNTQAVLGFQAQTIVIKYCNLLRQRARELKESKDPPNDLLEPLAGIAFAHKRLQG